MLAIEIDEIDWELHKKGMHRLAGNNPHAFPGRKAFSPEKPFRALGAAAGHFRTIGDLDWSDFTDIDGLDDLPLPRVDFWRITGGVTFKF